STSIKSTWRASSRNSRSAIVNFSTSGTSRMSAHQDVFGFVHLGRHVGRPAMVGMELLHERPMGASDFLPARAFRETKKLVGLIFRQGSGSPPPSVRAVGIPRVSLTLCCTTPAGKPAVEIRL